VKHRALLIAIGDSAIDELKPLLAPLIAANFGANARAAIR
jgi:hypothetical protein